MHFGNFTDMKAISQGFSDLNIADRFWEGKLLNASDQTHFAGFFLTNASSND